MDATKIIATGDYLFFAIAATGTSSALIKPAANDAAWITLGVVESHEDKLDDEKEEKIFAPQGTTGVLTIKDTVVTKQNLEFVFTTGELTPLALQAFYRTLNLTTASTQFNPLSGNVPKGWLKVQRYAQDGVAAFVADLWGRLKVTGGMKSGDGSIIKPAFSHLLLQSTLNTVAIA
jgi:hypothetical protein